MVEAVIAPLRGDKQREQEPTNDAVPVAGRDRILVLRLSSLFILPLAIRILFAYTGFCCSHFSYQTIFDSG